MYLPTSGKVS